MVTKERESRPLLNVTPESEFEVQGVNVEGIGGDDEEGTSQSSQTQKVGEEMEMIIERIFICNIEASNSLQNLRRSYFRKKYLQ